MKSILLPTDFSNNSMNAIDYAMLLFENVHCDFYILNVQKASSFISDDMMVMSASATIYQTLIDASKKSIDNIITKVKKNHKNDKHGFHSIVDYDNFIDSINQATKLYHIDLIIMGTKGATGLDKVLFGSNTVRVMQRCETPVLAIPDGCQFMNLDKIAFTTNYLSLYNIKDTAPLKDILNLFDSELSILHLADENHLAQKQDSNIEFLNSQFPNAIHEYIDMESNDMFKTIQQYIINNNIKMLAMMSKRHSFLERLFIRHNVETFAFSISIPFLVMENHD